LFVQNGRVVSSSQNLPKSLHWVTVFTFFMHKVWLGVGGVAPHYGRPTRSQRDTRRLGSESARCSFVFAPIRSSSRRIRLSPWYIIVQLFPWRLFFATLSHLVEPPRNFQCAERPGHHCSWLLLSLQLRARHCHHHHTSYHCRHASHPSSTAPYVHIARSTTRSYRPCLDPPYATHTITPVTSRITLQSSSLFPQPPTRPYFRPGKPSGRNLFVPQILSIHRTLTTIFNIAMSPRDGSFLDYPQ
jgi:hypothetical protein